MSESQKYIDSVDGNAHQSAVRIIEELSADNARLREQVRKLREALKPFADEYEVCTAFDASEKRMVQISPMKKEIAWYRLAWMALVATEDRP